MAKPPVNWSNVSMLTPGMKNLGNQFNRRWPTRYGDSDGAQGDYKHQQGTSDHNPDDTSYDNAGWDNDSDSKSEIRAIDVDKDLNESGSSMQKVIDHMRKLKNLSSVIRYMIYNGKMYHVDDGFEPTDYDGDNDHSEHAHFSGARSQSADEDNSFDYRFEEVGNMALTDADVDKIWGKAFDNPYTEAKDDTSAGGYLRYAPSLSKITGEVKAAVKPDFDQLDQSNAALAASNVELSAKVDTLTTMVAELTALIEGHVSGIIESVEGR